jgi:class 3 adenylate cyclase/tetratricopeptide (TPR) repeat protein
MATCSVCGEANAARARFCSNCGRPLAPGVPIGESRKTVTVLFADVSGSTALGERLDPEAVRQVMGRYFGVMRSVIEAHGGTVEKFIGDAVMAVFGIPLVHEDDALRAVRASVEIERALRGLNDELTETRGVALRFRTGINTGPVVAGDPATGQTLVTGDTVNTAARLEQAAAPGETLIGRATYLLVADAVDAEAAEPIVAKGKAEPVRAWRLLGVRGGIEAARRRPDTSIVGRDREVAWLQRQRREVARDRSPRLALVVGPAGIGKSRIVAAFRHAARGSATVLRGRCLAYGQGITWWPIGEVMREAAGIVQTDTPEGAVRRLRELLAGEEDGAAVATTIAAAIGLTADLAREEDLFWAVRRAFEVLARRRPLVVVIEDLHWAAPSLLELLTHLASRARDVPLLVVGTGRPELLEDDGMPSARDRHVRRLTLGPLSPDAVQELLDALPGGSALSDRLRARIHEASDGNPLYAEELLGMLVDDGRVQLGPDGTWSATPHLDEVPIPPSIGALLAARLERLPAAERVLIGPAAVVGRVFERDAVEVLAPDAVRGDVAGALLALVRRDLVQRDRSPLVSTEAFRFRHALIRDAAYEALPKAQRADLHERFVAWVEAVAGERVLDLDPILGHHLAQAYRYRTELGERSAEVRETGIRAARYLLAAGRRARRRGDEQAGLTLLRPVPTLPRDDVTVIEALVELAGAESRLGRAADGVGHARDALLAAAALGDRRVEALARLATIESRIAHGELTDLDAEAHDDARRALEDARAAGDEGALALAHAMLGAQAYMDGRTIESAEHNERAVRHARAGGDDLLALELGMARLVEVLVGTTPAPEVVGIATDLLPTVSFSPALRADALRILAVAEAMTGDFVSAAAHSSQSVAITHELGMPHDESNTLGDACWVHRLAGNLPAAEATARAAREIALAAGDPTDLAWISCRLAQVLMDAGREAEVESLLREAEAVPLVMNRSRVLGTRARLLASAGEAGAARTLVEELLVAIPAIHGPNIRVDALLDAAEALALIGERERAVSVAGEALALAQAKGNVARAGQIAGRLEVLATAARAPRIVAS